MSELQPDESKINLFVQGVLGHADFDERVDSQPDINTDQALHIAGRAIALLAPVMGLFTLKFLLYALSMIPYLVLPWMAKIVTDNVLLGQEFGTTEVRYPPFMDPLLDVVQARNHCRLC